MKMTINLLLVLTVLAVCASAVRPPYDKTQPPKMTLPDAYDRAIAALGPATNQFHCVSATLTNEFSDDGWYFTFYSTNSNVMPKLVVVEFNGKVIFDNGYR